MKHAARTREIARVFRRLQKATGADRDLDAAVHSVVSGRTETRSGDAVPQYTASVPACFELIHRALPGWKWHVGYGVEGIFPYASVSDDRGELFESTAPTVPLALLRALLRAMARP